MVCSKQASLEKEWCLDDLPNVEEIRTSSFVGNHCLPVMSDSISSVSGNNLLIHSLILVLLFRVILDVKVIANF